MAFVLGSVRWWTGRTRLRNRFAGPFTMRARLERAERANADFVRVNAKLVRLNGELNRANAALSDSNRDLSRANSELTRSVEELTVFAGEISHDLKGPLAAVTGYAQLLACVDIGYPRPFEYDEFLTELTNSVDRMRRLIENVLAYATAPDAQLNLATVELGPLVEEAIAARTDHLRHQTTGAITGGKAAAGRLPEITVESLPVVVADPVMLRRVIDNLISNALKYVRPGDAARVHIGASLADGGWVRIEVTDQGIGIPDGQHEAIFDGLHRAHANDGYPGSGLGLAICRRIVQRHGGFIGASPRPQGGTRFWLTLPAPR